MVTNESHSLGKGRTICGVYCIRNAITGEEYIGSSIDIDRRFLEHRRFFALGKKHNRRLRDAWAKYGADAFEFSILEECSEEKLVEIENMHFKKRKPRYNLRDWATNQLHFRMPDAAKNKIGTKRKGQKPSEAATIAHTLVLQKTCPGFIAPDGTVYSPVTNISQFAQEHGLVYRSLARLMRGERKTYRGWKRIEKEA